MFDEKTNAFLDNLVKGASNEELFKMERLPAAESTPQQVAKPVYEKAPERDLASEMILSFAPAIVGAFGGESAAIAQAPAGEKARKFYEDARKQEIEKIESRNKQAKESYADQTKQALDRKEREDKLRAQIQMAKESNALRKEIADQSSEDRKAIASATRQEKSDKAATKAEEKNLELAVPGFKRTGEVLPKTEEAVKLRKATVTADQLQQKLQRLKDLTTEKGSFEYGGDAGQEMASLATEIQLLGKSPEMYELGVLTGPDLKLLEKITSDPESLNSLFTRDKTRLKQIDTQIKSVKDKIQSTAKSMGYVGDVKSDQQKQVSGFTEDKAKRLAELRAKKEAGKLGQ